MKGCFLLQRKFAPIGHRIAVHLKTMGAVDEFCAYVGLRAAHDFLRTQKEISYTALLLDENIQKKIQNETLDKEYLEKLEQEYGLPNLWPYLTIDRIFMHGQLLREYPHDWPILSHEEMLITIQVTAKEIIAFLDREKPDFLVMIVVASVGSKLLYHIAKKKGVKTLFLDPSRIGNGLIATDTCGIFSEAEKIFDRLQKSNEKSLKEEDAKKFIEAFRVSPAPYSPDLVPTERLLTRRQMLRFLAPKNLMRSLSWITKLHVDYFTKKTHDYTDEVPWLVLLDRIRRRVRGLYGFSDFYKIPKNGEPYAFYPLHYEPEFATLLFAPLYATDQIYLIKHIARSLPVQWKLYVKEHPSMFGYRPRKYYRELKKIPNVKIIDPVISSLDLMQNARMITTINGTAGFEGLLLKKPVITFGEIFYNKLSTVMRCRSLDELPNLVQEQIKNFRHNEKELVRFVAAIMEDSVDVDLITLWEKEDQEENIKKDVGLKNLARLIAKKVGAVS